MKHKLLSVISISFILLLLFNVKTVAIENKDNNPEMTDERAIEIIKEIADFMDSGEKIGDEISCRESDGYNDYYFKNNEDEEKLYKYHRDYIKDAAYDYLCEMYDIRFYRGRCTQSRTSRSSLSSCLYYKIYTDGEFSVKSRSKKSICVQIQFVKKVILAEDMPEISDGEVYLELCEDNKWRISKVSQWINDLAYYDLGNEMKVFFDQEYNYFIRKSRYEENESFKESDLTDIEKENIKIISDYIESF